MSPYDGPPLPTHIPSSLYLSHDQANDDETESREHLRDTQLHDQIPGPMRYGSFMQGESLSSWLYRRKHGPHPE